MVVTLFLTMLVGAGGNAGNQSAIKVIRGLVSCPYPNFWPHQTQQTWFVYPAFMQATKSISLTPASISTTLLQQSGIGLLLGFALSGLPLDGCQTPFALLDFPAAKYCNTRMPCSAGGGFLRVYLTNGSLINATAISVSLFAIVMTSVLTGTALPFALAKIGVDPANAGTSIQAMIPLPSI